MPQQTLALLAGQTVDSPELSLRRLCEPFVPGALEACFLPWWTPQIQEREVVIPRDVLIDPSRLNQSLGQHGSARLGFRARRRYQIDPKAWQDRWG